MRIVTVVGARPQFIKAAAVSRKIRQYASEILVHTGQHYDENMSDIFFKELDIATPDYNLHVGSASHARQTAEMLEKLEKVYLLEKPDYVLVYGDTNSTLAAALAASKMLIPIIHVEAGLRSYNMKMPEEQNRVLTDHISSYLFCPTQSSVDNLHKENIYNNVYCVGDVMCDAMRYYINKINQNNNQNFYLSGLNKLYKWDKDIKKWYMATVHRAENTRKIEQLEVIFSALEKLDFPVIFPVHPRIRSMVDELHREKQYSNICFVEPLGYLEMLYFTMNAIKVVTDSGGLQKEAYMLHKNVVTLRNQTEWIETLKGNHNCLCEIEEKKIIDSVLRRDIDTEFDDSQYGTGDAAEKICNILFDNI